VRREFRALALAAVGGLLLAASTTFASAPGQFLSQVKPDAGPVTPWLAVFRETMGSRMIDRADASATEVGADFDRGTTPVDFGSRYDGKQVPN